MTVTLRERHNCVNHRAIRGVINFVELWIFFVRGFPFLNFCEILIQRKMESSQSERDLQAKLCRYMDLVKSLKIEVERLRNENCSLIRQMAMYTNRLQQVKACTTDMTTCAHSLKKVVSDLLPEFEQQMVQPVVVQMKTMTEPESKKKTNDLAPKHVKLQLKTLLPVLEPAQIHMPQQAKPTVSILKPVKNPVQIIPKPTAPHPSSLNKSESSKKPVSAVVKMPAKRPPLKHIEFTSTQMLKIKQDAKVLSVGKSFVLFDFFFGLNSQNMVENANYSSLSFRTWKK